MSRRVHTTVMLRLAAGLTAAGLLGLAAAYLARPIRVGTILMPLWVRTTYSVPYGPYPENRLDLMWPRRSTAKPRPAVIVFHGGGWLAGDRHDTIYRVCRPFLELGFLVVNVEYRLGAVEPGAEDAARALRWFRDVAHSYGADARQIVVAGESAGGQLALLTGFQSGGPIAAIVNFYAPNNLNALLWRPEYRAVLRDADPESLARRLSPLTYVRRGLPPVYSVHGSDDDIVPPSQTEILTRSILAAGGDATALYIQGGRHGFTPRQEDLAFEGIAAFLRRLGIVAR